jgi:hypothetical protein
VTWPDGRTMTGDAHSLDKVPSYPAGTDPATVEYSFENDDLLTRAEIDEKFTRCARENV